MKVYEKISEINSAIASLKAEGKNIGFVPTMGALHEDHLSLMRQAKAENDILVVSIFVNPIQFNNKADLEKYPRVLEDDFKLLKEVNCDIVFTPSVDEMYPEQVNKEYDFGLLGEVMEGANRPGHFNGVAIVVKKLFDICIPHKAYFGEKDFQQLAIIKKLVKLENLDVEIIPCAIVRESDGLAMSSRNMRLSKQQREKAPFIYQTLHNASEWSKTFSYKDVKRKTIAAFEDKNEFQLEYFEIAESVELQAVDNAIKGQQIMGFIVVNMGDIRLIDNIRLFNNFASDN